MEDSWYQVYRKGDPDVSVGYSKDGEIEYVYHELDFIKFYDEDSALGFLKACERANLRRYQNLSKNFLVRKITKRHE